MPLGLPPDLARTAERTLRSYDRGLMTRDELDEALWNDVHTFAEQEFDRAHPDWADEALLGRDAVAWEIGFEARGNAAAQAGAAYALALADKHEHATGLVARVFGSPQWQQALEPVRARLTKAATAGPEAMEALAWTGWLAALRGVLPPEAREAVRAAPVSPAIAMVDLLEADREGDSTRVEEIVAAAGQRGCVSPAVGLIRFRRNEGRSVAVS
ncbi:hypothetical protein [Nocardioides kribbensis]|uniref:DUF222 domain-containing protein n=1 Tax=Nocardioides kribbensis TaxID=305517 RepID=A0ABV1NTC6_9ACTN